MLPAFFVTVRAAWLATPSQNGPHRHFFLSGAGWPVGSRRWRGWAIARLVASQPVVLGGGMVGALAGRLCSG
jgi:hypothetical protein